MRRLGLALALGVWTACGGEAPESGLVVDLDADGSPAGVDCDDSDPLVNPSALERCNGIDDDCDALIDDDDDGLTAEGGQLWYVDDDGDGYGAGQIVACVRPAGASASPGDCDDADAERSPQAPERCDGIDQDCDGRIDNDPIDGWPLYRDVDDDGFGGELLGLACAAGPGETLEPADCDDFDDQVSPGGTEVCDAADRDEDCDGLVDDADPSVDPASLLDWYGDGDADGHGDPASIVLACDGGAGTSATPTDCDDANPLVQPGAVEVCNSIDDDCDGLVDDEDPSIDPATQTLVRPDRDGDGFGDTLLTTPRCALAAGFVLDATDCDDTDETSFPGAPEYCDRRDNDCDGDIDDADDDVVVGDGPQGQQGAIELWLDADEDGFGAGDVVPRCELLAGWATNDADCVDDEATVHPLATEVCRDGFDTDCDGSAAPCGARGDLAPVLDAQGQVLLVGGWNNNPRFAWARDDNKPDRLILAALSPAAPADERWRAWSLGGTPLEQTVELSVDAQWRLEAGLRLLSGNGLDGLLFDGGGEERWVLPSDADAFDEDRSGSGFFSVEGMAWAMDYPPPGGVVEYGAPHWTLPDDLIVGEDGQVCGEAPPSASFQGYVGQSMAAPLGDSGNEVAWAAPLNMSLNACQIVRLAAGETYLRISVSPLFTDPVERLVPLSPGRLETSAQPMGWTGRSMAPSVDIDGDGLDELAYTRTVPQGTIMEFYNAEAVASGATNLSQLSLEASVVIGEIGSFQTVDVSAADLDGDGRPELVLSTLNEVAVYRGPIGDLQLLDGWAVGWGRAQVVDLDGDEVHELCLVEADSPHRVACIRGGDL